MSFRDQIKAPSLCPNKLRIGVFFDGTGNNRFNDAKESRNIKVSSPKDQANKNVAQNSALAKFNQKKPSPEKEDKRSNISKLYALYKTSPSQVDGKPQVNKSIYKQGVGTNAGKDDYTTGLVAGSGGAKRINEAIAELMGILSAHPEKEYERTIDVFGFSRGAAQARDFINTFYFQHKKLKFEFGFVGIYDTVGSFGMAGDNDNYKPKNPNLFSEHDRVLTAFNPLTDKMAFQKYNFHLRSESAQRIVHMTAAQEVRKNFPLSNIQGSGHAEWQFIGVHSDIGGGYAEKFGNDWLDMDVIERKYFPKSDQSKIRTAVEKATGQGYYVKSEDVLVGMNSPRMVSLTIFKRRYILQDLAKVTLHKMYDEAVVAQVPMDPIPSNDAYDIPADLHDYHQYVMLQDGHSTGYRDGERIKDKWAHRSHYDLNDFSDWKRKVANKPQKIKGKHRRVVFNNIPKRAISPA